MSSTPTLQTRREARQRAHVDPLAAQLRMRVETEAIATKLDEAMSGLGTDEAAIDGLLKGQNKVRIDAISAAYTRRTNRSLQEDLTEDLSGRGEFEALLALRGDPTSLDEKISVATDRRDFEREGGINAAGRWLVDAFSDRGEEWDTSIDDLKTARREADLDGVVTDEEASALQEKIDASTEDMTQYRQTKDKAVEVAGTVASIAGSVVAVVATGGAAAPIVIGAAAGAGALSRAAVTKGVGGRSIGVEEGAQAAAVGAVEGVGTGLGVRAAAAIGGGLARGGPIGVRMARGVAIGAAAGVVDGAVSVGGGTAVRDATWSDGVANGARRVVGQTAKGAAIGGAAGGVLGGAVGALPERLLRGASIKANEVDFGSGADTVSNAQKFIIPIKKLEGGGERLVYPKGHPEAGKPIVDFEGTPVGDRGVVFYNPKDQAVQGVTGDGTGVVIINQVDEKHAAQLLRELGPDPSKLDVARLERVLAKQYDVYHSDVGFVGSKMNAVESKSTGVENYGLHRRDDRDIVKALYVPGRGEFHGSATKHQYKRGAVLLKQGDDVRLIQPNEFVQTYRNKNGTPIDLRSLPRHDPR